MKTFSKNGNPSITLIDKNIASDYGNLGKLFELKNRNANTLNLNNFLHFQILNAGL